ncbi:MAG TPA: hypothetical protein VM925_11110, partial [Labilithrix sp.]|nr:hypothetical protein [Labilithrix sp.]
MGQRQGGGGRVSQDIEIDGRALDKSIGRKQPDQLLPTNAWKVSTDASDQRGFENAQPQQVRQARTFACAIEPEIVTRILTVGVVERV